MAHLRSRGWGGPGATGATSGRRQRHGIYVPTYKRFRCGIYWAVTGGGDQISRSTKTGKFVDADRPEVARRRPTPTTAQLWGSRRMCSFYPPDQRALRRRRPYGNRRIIIVFDAEYRRRFKRMWGAFGKRTRPTIRNTSGSPNRGREQSRSHPGEGSDARRSRGPPAVSTPFTAVKSVERWFWFMRPTEGRPRRVQIYHDCRQVRWPDLGGSLVRIGRRGLRERTDRGEHRVLRGRGTAISLRGEPECGTHLGSSDRRDRSNRSTHSAALVWPPGEFFVLHHMTDGFEGQPVYTSEVQGRTPRSRNSCSRGFACAPRGIRVVGGAWRRAQSDPGSGQFALVRRPSSAQPARGRGKGKNIDVKDGSGFCPFSTLNHSLEGHSAGVGEAGGAG